MRKSLAVLLVLFCLFVSANLVFAGNINSPGPPSAGSGMITMQELYDYLTSGLDPAAPGDFKEPVSGPGSTGKSIQEIYEGIKLQFDDSAATPADVRTGVKFFSTESGTWGSRTGTANGCVPACMGSLSPGGRWCDNEDGTVTDMTTGLVWLQKADWGGGKPWRSNTIDNYDDAHTRASLLCAGATGANLSDGSVEGDWRLPTKSELVKLTYDSYPEYVRSGSPREFDDVQPGCYWSSTSVAGTYAWAVYLGSPYDVATDFKEHHNYVWPVRGGQ